MTTLPSPASSPMLKPGDLSSQNHRKRQRSQSMESDESSSSVKRSVSDGTSFDDIPLDPSADEISAPSFVDPLAGIFIPSEDIPCAEAVSCVTSEISPRERHDTVLVEKNRSMKVGETWYLISRDWWKRWEKACTGKIDKEGPLSEAELGPVDNSTLLDSYGDLYPSLAEGVDLEFVPENTWKSFVAWYGQPLHALPRSVVARGAARQAALELHPRRIKVLKLTRDECNASTDGPPHPWVVISAGDTMKGLCERLATAVSPNPQSHKPYRIWKIWSELEDWTYSKFPASKLPEFGGKIIEESDRTLEEEFIESGDTFVVELKQSDGWLVNTRQFASEAKNSNTNGPVPLFSSKDGFFNKMGGNSLGSSKSNGGYSGLGSKSSAITSFSKDNHNLKSLEPGTLGLGNMGNTCFMNSALQCLAHTKELTDYFLSGVFEDELNPDNPLGMGGAIAETFGALLQRIWSDSGSSTSYSPREFKTQLQRFAPQFSGYQQHDSQELVAFLLDGLHEDLNRVLKKPYVEKPDWEGGGDLELVRLAMKSWEGYMMRNDSVIVDLFQGQYQSTLVCPECAKVSITFDPFMYLTLPLPVQKKWKHTIYYVPWDADKSHVRIPVEISRDASFKDLRILLGRWMDVPPDNLLTMEIFSHRFYKNLDDSIPCGEMSDNDTIVCFELPCHAQQSRTYKKQEGDPFIVPVFLCDVKAPLRNTYLTTRSPALFGYPTVAVIYPEQSTTVDAMYDAIITRLQRWTSNARDLFQWEHGSGSAIDSVSFHLNGCPPMDSIAEITEHGEVVKLETAAPEEGDIVDEKDMIVVDTEMSDPFIHEEPRKVGTKKNVFALRLQVNHKDLGTTYNSYSSNGRWESWESRKDEDPILLREGDAFYCEFDENMKAYYFGDEGSRWEHALWDHWEEFIHPELEESKKRAAEKRTSGLSLQDCLDEFIKEEKLGEDDLWYCPRCKKHQQATKRFDLWKAPDILVVHLKRFSNSRTLRDKIDALIDFPVEGLDLGNMVGERAVAKRLLEQGVNIEELGISNLDEPLIYDLYGVDEHMGGLGGGHYRAYASNHLTGKWYHFDDSFVTPSRATDSVNANAYLLFYRRRSNGPLGGKSHEKIESARSKPKAGLSTESSMTIDAQLPTPPNEPSVDYIDGLGLTRLSTLSPQLPAAERWNLRSSNSNGGSSIPSPPPDDPPELLGTEIKDPLELSSYSYDFPISSSNGLSPSSSTEADADLESDDGVWQRSRSLSVGVEEVGADEVTEWDVASNMASPALSNRSDIDPFDDLKEQKLNEDLTLN